jgi:osmotically-inducible protein OsmY
MRSDSELQSDIQVEISRRFSAGAEGIVVRVLDGMVTLTGHLGSDLEGWQLDDAVRTMSGVQGLIDETLAYVDVGLAGPDSDIARPWFPAR